MGQQSNDAVVLVVDDEPIIRQQLSQTLESVGIDCHCAINGEDALRKIAKHPYELVITDLRMPVRHGHSLAQTLLNHLTPPKIVVLTGVTERRMKADLLARGVADVVYKPVDYFEFTKRLIKLFGEAPSAPAAAAPKGAPQPEAPSRARAHEGEDQLREEVERLECVQPRDNCWATTVLHWIDWSKFSNPPVELMIFARRLSRRSASAAAERRRDPRVIMDEVAIAIELDENRQPIGAPFKLLVRDVSRSGMGLAHTQKVNGSFLAVTWGTLNQGRAVAVIKLLRCQNLAEFFEIGGTFVSD